MTTRFSISLILICLAAFAPGATAQNTHTCPLTPGENGQVITIHGVPRSEPHDMALDIPGCGFAVLATIAGDAESDIPGTQRRNDRAMRRFIKYTSSTYKSRGNHICMGCSRYEITSAELTGKLEVAVLPGGATRDRLGRTWDSNGKFIGILGWGHPAPFADYRIVIVSVLQVQARKLPRPKL